MGLNSLAAAAPVVLQLTADAQLVQHGHGGGVADVLARETLRLITGAEQQRLRRCRAPGCGMFFLARRCDQAWCSIGCGNRARAARREAAWA
jgi:predicted RNA-binding Zn ribbon-like protein